MDPETQRLNFNHLHYFVAIAREGSIKAAGRKLRISASALSAQLKQLENFLGRPLFDRKVRKLILNPTGKIVLEKANTIFGQAEELVRSVRLPEPKGISVIRVGILPSLSKTQVHDLVLPLWKDSSVCVTVIEKQLSALNKELEEGSLDLILSDRPTAAVGMQYKSFRLQHRRIVAVAPKKFASAKARFPKSLDKLPLLHLTGHSQLRTDIDYFFEQQGISPRIVGEADDSALLRIAAEKGVGFTILPKNTVKESLKSGTLIQLGELTEIESDMWATLKTGSDHATFLKDIIRTFHDSQEK